MLFTNNEVMLSLSDTHVCHLHRVAALVLRYTDSLATDLPQRFLHFLIVCVLRVSRCTYAFIVEHRTALSYVHEILPAVPAFEVRTDRRPYSRGRALRRILEIPLHFGTLKQLEVFLLLFQRRIEVSLCLTMQSCCRCLSRSMGYVQDNSPNGAPSQSRCHPDGRRAHANSDCHICGQSCLP